MSEARLSAGTNYGNAFHDEAVCPSVSKSATWHGSKVTVLTGYAVGY